jgi:hypothetical protein
LQWFADHEAVSWFDAASPTNAMRRRLEKAGLIVSTRPQSGIGMLKWSITDAGKRALCPGENGDQCCGNIEACTKAMNE